MRCQASFPIDMTEVFGSKKLKGGGRGKRVECSVCGNNWFQTTDRGLIQVSNDDSNTVISAFTDSQVQEMKGLRDDSRQSGAGGNRKWTGPCKPAEVFVGNIPFSYTESDVGDLFAEYGITQIRIGKSPENESRGFALVTVGTEADAELLIEEMSDFCLGVGMRRLKVRFSDHRTRERE
jgi:hypothetical protein